VEVARPGGAAIDPCPHGRAPAGVWLLKMDGTIVAVVRSRYPDVVVQALMHALVVVVPMVWLLIMDATMVAMMLRGYADLVVHALMYALMVMVPMV